MKNQISRNQKKALSVKELSYIGAFTALTAILSQIAVPLPFTPVPLSLGLLAVYATALLLKTRAAMLSQICYLLIGAAGIPVFANFRGGLSALLGPTGGYLIAYPIVAGIVSLALSRAADGITFRLKAVAALVTAQIVLYLFGTVWLSVSTNNTFTATLALAVYPYIPLDLAKIAASVVVILPLRFRLARLVSVSA